MHGLRWLPPVGTNQTPRPSLVGRIFELFNLPSAAPRPYMNSIQLNGHLFYTTAVSYPSPIYW